MKGLMKSKKNLNQLSKKAIFTIVVILVMTIILGMFETVKAADSSFKANITANKTELKAGEEVTVTLGVSDINMGENGINTIEGKITYDKDIFETITSSSITNLNNWSVTYNDTTNEKQGKFLAVNLSNGVKEETQIFSVKFKVKENITEEKETKISFKDITSNDGKNLVNSGTKTVTLKINKSTNQNNANNSNENKNQTTNSNSTNTTSKKKESSFAKSTNNAGDKTTVTSKLPKTGKPVVIGLVAILLITIVALYIKNRTMRDIK